MSNNVLKKPTGLGANDASIVVYVDNTPSWPEGFSINTMRPLQPGELNILTVTNSNHWRKVFNVFAKLLFTINSEHCNTWQQFRDERLFQTDSGHAMVFSSNLESLPNDRVHLICGKHYAIRTGYADASIDFSQGIVTSHLSNVIVTPYFDYRQFPNIAIESAAQSFRKRYPEYL